MYDNLKLFLSEFEKYKGQHVITDSFKIERLIAIGEDDMDYYYVTFDGRNINWHSGVGRIMPLKGQLRDEDYNYIVNIAKLNHYDQLVLKNDGNIDAFLIAVEEDFSKYTNKEKFLSEICWDLN